MVGRFLAVISLLSSCLLTFLVRSEKLGFDDNISDQFNKLESSLAERQKELSELAHQLMFNRFYSAERIRSEGDGGLVTVRHIQSGSYDYHNGGPREFKDFAALHDHALQRDVLGMGEVMVVMNGIQFTTRHSDYRFRMANDTSNKLHETKPIPDVPIPPSVLALETVEDQVAEMIEYFRAFKLQNTSIRDYKPYFRPVMCYIEGYWLSDWKNLVDIPNTNDNFDFKAYQWDDLNSQAQMNAKTGASYFYGENTAFLPRSIVGMNTAGMPIYAQWHYRLLCHPIKEDIPTKHLKAVDDLSYRMAFDVSLEQLSESRGTRFIMDDLDAPGLYKEPSLLDRCVGQFPGLDNNPDYIKETDYLRRDTMVSATNKTVLNLGHYNRCYFDKWRSPDRRHERCRGFSDNNVFLALNTQQAVAPINITFRIHEKDVRTYPNLRFSWMLPVELIYRTPLAIWNPHGLAINYNDPNLPEVKNLTSTAGTESDPWLGIHEKKWLLTPEQFYTNRYPTSNQKSDDWYDFTYVKSTKGPNPALVGASGLQRLTPPINKDVGTVRLGYPIMPLHVSGNPVMKELSGLKTLLTREMMKLAESLKQLSGAKK